jgi:gas vesicle protein
MSENNRDVITAFLLGGSIGVIVGLLFAPRSGRDTRRRLERWMEDIEERSEDILAKGRDILENGRDLVHDKSRKVRRVLNDQTP